MEPPEAVDSIGSCEPEESIRTLGDGENGVGWIRIQTVTARSSFQRATKREG